MVVEYCCSRCVPSAFWPSCAAQRHSGRKEGWHSSSYWILTALQTSKARLHTSGGEAPPFPTARCWSSWWTGCTNHPACNPLQRVCTCHCIRRRALAPPQGKGGYTCEQYNRNYVHICSRSKITQCRKHVFRKGLHISSKPSYNKMRSNKKTQNVLFCQVSPPLSPLVQ